MNVTMRNLLFASLIYIGGFILLLVIKQLKRSKNISSSSNSPKEELINFLTFLYLPLLIPISLLGEIGITLLNLVEKHTSPFIKNVLQIILFPLSLLNAMGNAFSPANLGKIIQEVKNKFKNHYSKKSVKKMLKLYQQYTKNLINIDGSFLRDYYAEQRYKFLAFLLQIVSFFTTYAGVELFFGNLFDYATLFITLVIQVGLYTSAVTSSKPGKRNFRSKVIKYLLVLVSVCFSYIGLITLASPPVRDYESAYNTYYANYTNVVDELKNQIYSSDHAAEYATNELKSELSKIPLAIKQFGNKINELNSLLAQTKPNTTTEKSTVKSYDENGNIIEETIITTSTNNSSFMNDKETKTSQINNLIDAYKMLTNELDALSTTQNPLPHFPNIDFNNSSFAIDVDFSNCEEEANDFLCTALEPIYKISEDSSEENTLTQKVAQLISTYNYAIALCVPESTSLTPIDKNFLDTQQRSINKYNSIKDLTLPKWDELKAASNQEINLKQETFPWNPKSLIIKIGGLFGANLNNTDMRELLDLHQDITDEVENSYNRILPYLDETNSARILKDSKKHIDEIPNILFIGFLRFKTPGTHQSNAIICALLAIFNDFTTLLLGWAGAKKAYSFLYIKSSKDYYNDIDELFGIIFKSMQQNFYLAIRAGSYTNMNKEAFIQECLNNIISTAKTINSFLDSFTLSECTSQMGYNLKLIYTNETEMQKFLPLISVLLKTNMLKVIPYTQYQHFELDYYCGINMPLWETDLSPSDEEKITSTLKILENVKTYGNVLLLRNRAENYLRENMCVVDNEKEE